MHRFNRFSVVRTFQQPVYRLGFVVILLLAAIAPVWAQSPNGDVASKIYLPLIAGNGDLQASAAPLRPDQYDSQSENPPSLEQVQAATFCFNWIRFSNQSSQNIYIYWVNAQSQEVLYNTLAPRTYY
ncbi:MAG: hypothetical protein M3Q45_12785 [Chloroflexota bacterium]|nr:hypothetical protein [Chloroflexota bacterium]